MSIFLYYYVIFYKVLDGKVNEMPAFITLFSDAKASKDRFAICRHDGLPVWYGRFFDSDRDYNGEQSSGEMAAAKKAVWLASKVKEHFGLTEVNLTLKVDAQWLRYANWVAAEVKGGGKARTLGLAAIRLGVRLTVEWIPGKKNPADEYTVCKGYLSWKDIDLESLIDQDDDDHITLADVGSNMGLPAGTLEVCMGAD